MAVQLRLEPRQEVFALGVEAIVDVRIVNGLSETLRVPDPGMPGSRQPRFRLREPDGKETTFVPAEGRGVSPSAPSPVLDLAPGAEASGEISLGQFVKLVKEGDYELSATLDLGGRQVAAQPVRIRVEAMGIANAAAFLARSTDGEAAAGLVVLTASGRLGTASVRERDPRNGELFALEPKLGAAAPGAKRARGWHANYGIAFDPLRWLLAVSGDKLLAATNLSGQPAAATCPKPVALWLDGLVVKGHGLTVPAIARAGAEWELMVFEGSAPTDVPRLKPPRSVARFSGPVAAAAAVLAPDDGRILVAAVQRVNGHTPVRCWILANGAAKLSNEFSIEGLSKPLAVAAGWSSRDEIRVSVLGLDAAGKALVAELHLRPDLTQEGPAHAEPIGVEDVHRGQLAYFEQEPGVLSRVAVVKAPSGTFGVNAHNQVRSAQFPADGHFALVPGRSRWYVLWPTGPKLKISSF